ncbi:MAG: ATP synthase F0 subunit B [Deferrisomatales bacterium]|nr:ATP synthase F0 subunit B [Deferrisomatales bacterium]
MININATLVVQLVNFLLLMYLLNRILFRPMLRVLEERRERTEGRRTKAAQLESEAQAIWDDYQKRIHAAKADADRSRTQLVRQGETERDRLLAAATAEADKAVAQVRARLRGEAEEARRSLRAQAGQVAESIAQRILGRAV